MSKLSYVNYSGIIQQTLNISTMGEKMWRKLAKINIGDLLQIKFKITVVHEDECLSYKYSFSISCTGIGAVS